MAVSEQESIDLGLPVASAGTSGLTGVFSQATSTTAARYEIPDAWRGAHVRFFAQAVDLQIVFGGSTVACALDENSSVTSEVITFDVNTGFPVAAGTWMDFRIPRNKAVTHFSIDAGGAGRVFAFRATGSMADNVTK
jgi:hypothetical protein